MSKVKSLEQTYRGFEIGAMIDGNHYRAAFRSSFEGDWRICPVSLKRKSEIVPCARTYIDRTYAYETLSICLDRDPTNEEVNQHLERK